MAFSLRPVRLRALLLALLLASIVFAAPAFADDPEADGDAGLSAVVLRSIFTEPDANLAHNIPNLRVTVGGGGRSLQLPLPLRNHRRRNPLGLRHLRSR